MLYIVIISDSLPQQGNYNVTRSLLKRFPYYPGSATRVSTATCNKKGRRASTRYKERKREREREKRNRTKKREATSLAKESLFQTENQGRIR